MDATRSTMVIELRRIIQDALRDMDQDLTAMLDQLHSEITLITQPSFSLRTQQAPNIEPEPQIDPATESTYQPQEESPAKSTISKVKLNPKTGGKSKPRSQSHRKSKK